MSLAQRVFADWSTFVSEEKVNELWLFFFLLFFLSKFIDVYNMDTVWFLILLASEMRKIPRAKIEAHFIKKLAFITNKRLAQDTFGEWTRENLSKYIVVRE